jgi:RNA polymerase sigma factor (sigma-70 family)
MTSTANEPNYLQALCQNDSRLIREIYQRHAPSIQRWVLDNNGSSDDARDLFQDGLIAIYDRYCGTEFTLTSSFGALLFSICRRKWFDRLQQKSRETGVRLAEEKRYTDEEGLGAEPDAALEEQRKQETLGQTYGLLSEQCQQLLNLLSQGKSGEEIALQLGISNANAVYQSKHRCVGRLRQLFEEKLRN